MTTIPFQQNSGAYTYSKSLKSTLSTSYLSELVRTNVIFPKLLISFSIVTSMPVSGIRKP